MLFSQAVQSPSIACLLNRFERYMPMLALLCIGIAALMVYLFNPAKTAWFPKCPFRVMTELYCPGCGTLRALHQLLHGHLDKALGLNPLAVLVMPFLTYAMLVDHGQRLALPLRLPRFTLKAYHIYLLAGIFTVYGIARNLPIYPFTLLTP